MQVTRLVKVGTGKTTLAVGDGANDVGMLQEADIGVGISGVEGMQVSIENIHTSISFSFTPFFHLVLYLKRLWYKYGLAVGLCLFYFNQQIGIFS